MNTEELSWPSSKISFWDIQNDEMKILIHWSHDPFIDYRTLSYQFYECGFKTFENIIQSGHNNIKSDMWFLAAIFLVRQSIELGLKSLICRVCHKKPDIQSCFETYKHDLHGLFTFYNRKETTSYLHPIESDWLSTYLMSLEEVDRKSDMFRFPFDDVFLKRYRNKFLDNVALANNMLIAFSLIQKCIECQNAEPDSVINETFPPEFFVFSSHGIGNCYLWQGLFDDGFHVKVEGYISVIDFIYNNHSIELKTKAYPLLFLFRNSIELCLKQLLYSRIDDGALWKQFKSKSRSHLINRDLWVNIRPLILKYGGQSSNDIALMEIVDNRISFLSSIDKKGDMFRYPTSYSLEYRFDQQTFDMQNIYLYLKGVLNFLEACEDSFESIAEFQDEQRANMNDYY